MRPSRRNALIYLVSPWGAGLIAGIAVFVLAVQFVSCSATAARASWIKVTPSKWAAEFAALRENARIYAR